MLLYKLSLALPFSLHPSVPSSSLYAILSLFLYFPKGSGVQEAIVYRYYVFSQYSHPPAVVFILLKSGGDHAMSSALNNLLRCPSALGEKKILTLLELSLWLEAAYVFPCCPDPK